MMFRAAMTRTGEIYTFCDKFLQVVKIMLCCSYKRTRLSSWPPIDKKAKSKYERDG